MKRLKKSAREILRERADQGKQRARAQEQAARDKKANTLKAVQTTLQLAAEVAETRLYKDLAPGPLSLIRALREHRIGDKLVTQDNRTTLSRLGSIAHLREVRDWQPKGKGRNSLFKSLCEHLLSKYPTPPFLWSAFGENDENAKHLVPLVAHVAAGGSLFQFCKDRLPFPLTRAQCLDFIKSDSSLGVLSALRRVQVKAEGGDRRLFELWWSLPRNRTLDTPAVEAFSLSVLRFVARNPMLDPVQVGPLCDYVYLRYQREPNFSMQGRSANALLREMMAWHKELNLDKGGPKKLIVFTRSGFKSHRVEKADNRGPVGKKGYTAEPQIWSIEEIINSAELREEGRVMHHCVYSYTSQVEARHKSIWSLSLSDAFCPTEKLITLEVNNASRAVVQARGKYNRLTTAQEDKIIVEWAVKNALTIQYGGTRW